MYTVPNLISRLNNLEVWDEDDFLDPNEVKASHTNDAEVGQRSENSYDFHILLSDLVWP